MKGMNERPRSPCGPAIEAVDQARRGRTSPVPLSRDTPFEGVRFSHYRNPNKADAIKTAYARPQVAPFPNRIDKINQEPLETRHCEEDFRP